MPTIAPGRANTPDPAISPARNIAAVITPNPCAATSCSLNFLSISLILIPVYIIKCLINNFDETVSTNYTLFSKDKIN